MRLAITTILLAASMALFSQEENSLLWEISGNGLKSPSYLYGTMHVSKKIAFRLDDVFYEALDKSEIVALESDPETWLSKDEVVGLMGYNQISSTPAKGFYSRPFTLYQPTSEDLADYLSYDERVLNSIMYRSDKNSRDYEEDTYLDMFIYQSGKKFGKRVVALEELEESSVLTGRASLNAMKRKPDEWLQKKMREHDLMNLMQDAYRERNISLLDSIDRAVYTPYYLENMLYRRNENMTVRLDSIMRMGKVFAGIGAAHLPGHRGVITKLRNMGYTVKPLTSEVSARGAQLKKKLRKTYSKPNYTLQSPEDKRFSLLLPSVLYPVLEEDATTYVSTDLANGSYIMVNRIPTYSLIKKERYSLEDIDQLLFENIPGTILKKGFIEKDGYKGIDISNRLKNGDHQRYQIFLTPLEIIIVKMAGEGGFVPEFGHEVFDSITFKSKGATRITLSPEYEDFKIAFPGYYTFTNQRRKGNRKIEGYCEAKNSYYFLRKATLNDFRTVEEDHFELKQIQDRFYQDLGLDGEYTAMNRQRLRSRALVGDADGRQLYLQTAVKRGEYYLMGILTSDVAEAEAFFNSFDLQPSKYRAKFKSVIDTAMFFRTITPIKPLRFVESNIAYLKARDLKPYTPFTKKSAYVNNNDELITVTVSKANVFRSYPKIDSLWEARKKYYLGKTLLVRKEERKTSPEGNEELELILSDTASSRGIRIKNVVRGGLIYELKTLTDSLHAESKFVREFYENFKPLDTLIGQSVIGSRSTELFNAIVQYDSVLDQGFSHVNFNEENIPSLQYFLTNYSFTERRELQTFLIEQLGKLGGEKVIPMLSEFYNKSYHNSGAQAAVLKVIASQKTRESALKILELMEHDLPLLGNAEDIQAIFKPFNDSLNLAKDLFPEILKFSTIAEYKPHVIDLLAALKDGDYIKAAQYRKYKSQFLSDAKHYLKRQLSHQSNPGRRSKYYGSAVSRDRTVLKDYLTLLLPFAKDPGVLEFFQKVWLLEDPIIRTAYVSMLVAEDIPVPENILGSLASDINSRVSLYRLLSQLGQKAKIPEEYRSQQALAEALIFEGRRYSPEKDSIAFLTSEPIKYGNGEYTAFYFKTKNSEDYRGNFKLQFLVFETTKGIQTRAFYRNKGVRIEDTDLDMEVMARVRETFLLKDRARAVVLNRHKASDFGPFNF